MGRFDRYASFGIAGDDNRLFAGILEVHTDYDSIRGHHDHFVCWRNQPAVGSTRN